jgi:ribosome biogenesis GTPase A
MPFWNGVGDLLCKRAFTQNARVETDVYTRRRLQDEEAFLLTPFERNIEVWRQLWRVLERSHLVVQIVDARNPLRFRCEDLEQYVHDVEGVEGEAGTGKGKRRSMLLINKADLLTAKQRYDVVTFNFQFVH